jgi:hypothetical protein
MLARVRPYVLLFLALTVVYHANLRPVDSGDTLPGSLVPLAIFLDHSVTLDRFVPWLRGHVWFTRAVIYDANGRFFSRFPIGGPLLASPLYFPLAFIGLGHWDPGSLVMLARIAQKFAATTVTALSAVLLLMLLQRITTVRWAWCLTLVYALGTETWSVSSQALWQHGPGELAIIGCFYCLQRWTEDRARNGWLWLCGACVAAALVIRPTNLALLPAVLVGLLLAKASLTENLRLLALPLFGGLLVASYNFSVFHRVSGGYSVGVLKGSILPGLLGLYLSPGRGLLIYTPVALFALCPFLPRAASLSKVAERLQSKVLLGTAVAFVVLESFVLSRSVMWWGGYSWGPRLLTELAPPLIVLMALGGSVMDGAWPRRTFAVLALYSVLLQSLGVFFYPNGHWDGTPRSVDQAPSRLWDWKDNPIARAANGGFFWEPYAIVGAALTGGMPAARRRMRELNTDPYEGAEPLP